MGTNELIYKADGQNIRRKQTQLLGQKERGIRDKWETEIDIYTLLYIKQIPNKDLQYSTEKSLILYNDLYGEKVETKKSRYMLMYN